MGEAALVVERGPKGRRTHEAVVQQASAIAAMEGLAALTIGRIAEECGMSRSGIFAHFGSIENLRLAVVEYTRGDVEASIFEPASEAAEGLPRLYAALCLWLDLLEARVDRGGNLFFSAVPQFTGPPGPARDRYVQALLDIRDVLALDCIMAVRLGHLRSGVVVEELVAELHALLYGANWNRQALGDAESFVLARRAIERCLRMVATPEGVRAAKSRKVAPAALRPLRD